MCVLTHTDLFSVGIIHIDSLIHLSGLNLHFLTKVQVGFFFVFCNILCSQYFSHGSLKFHFI